MQDAFGKLGLERRLEVSADELREAFREAGKRAHPDAGGQAEAFASVEEARQVLADPGRRLRHWLELQGVEGGLRGSVSGAMMELFSRVGAGLQGADGLIRERERARSALAKALLEGRVQATREELESLSERISEATDACVGCFGRIEAGELDGWQVARDLAFLEKWRAQVRERFGGLW